MHRVILMFVLVLYPFSSGAQPYTKAECKEKVCKSKPFDPVAYCKKRRGRWNEKRRFCIRTRVRIRTRIVRKPYVVRSETVKVVRVPVEKTVVREVPVYSPPPPASAPAVSQKQEVNISNTTKKASPKESGKWWHVGADPFLLALYFSDTRTFMVGVEGKFLLDLNSRTRVKGMVGYSFLGESNLLLGAGVEVRVIEQMYLTGEFNTFWGDFEGLEVGRRYLLGGLGVSLWLLKDHLNISFSFVFGARKHVADCNVPEGFVGGNLLTVGGYL